MTDCSSSHLFRGARLFDGTRFLQQTDLRVSASGRVLAVEEGLEPQPQEVVHDCEGKWILPGLVDCHVHFREPGLERKEGYSFGSAGALHGGVTSLCEIQNNPPLMTSAALLAEKKENLIGVSRVDYAPYGTLTEDSIGALTKMRGHVPAVKCFLGGSTGAAGVKDEDSLRRLFQAAADAGLKVVAHCEDNEIMREVKNTAPPEMATRHDYMRPIRAEVESIRTALRVAAECKTDLHIFHISTAEGAKLISEAAANGQQVCGSVGPQYLLVDADEAHAMRQNRFKINPSIKDATQRAGLQEAVSSGALPIIGTDHAPHPLEDKDRAYPKAPSGFPSIDLLLPLLFAIHDDAGISLERLFSAVTSAPAHEFGLPQKGRLEVDADADFVIVDPSPAAARAVNESLLLSRSKWSPFHGRILRGWPEQVWLRGQLAFADGRVVGEPCGRPLFD